MILVDTSVWVRHLAYGEPALVAELNAGQVLTHPFIIGELACGNLGNRNRLLSLMRSLPQAHRATDDEVLSLIDGRKLMGRGIGYVDAHLLASVVLTTTATLWTRDKRLAAVANALSVADPRSP